MENITNSPLLEVRDLSVEYRTDMETVYAVNHVSFSLEKGKTLGLVGETGAGKTTTALALLRLLPERTGRVPNGEIIFEGRDLMGIKEGEMQLVRGGKISMIFQDPMTALNPVLTVGAQIREALELHNTTGEAIDLSGWYLSDTPGLPLLWRIPDGFVLQPGECRIVYASGRDRADAASPHANFGLSTEGETVTLANREGRLVDQVTYDLLADDEAWLKQADGSWTAGTPSPAAANG